MKTNSNDLLATEMNALVDTFFRDTTDGEFAKFLKEIDCDYYQSLTDNVLAQQLGAERFARQIVPTAFDFVHVREFRSFIEGPEQLITAADHQDLALAA